MIWGRMRGGEGGVGRGVWQIVIYPTDGNIRLLALSRGEIQYIWLDGVPGDSFLAEYSNMGFLRLAFFERNGQASRGI